MEEKIREFLDKHQLSDLDNLDLLIEQLASLIIEVKEGKAVFDRKKLLELKAYLSSEYKEVITLFENTTLEINTSQENEIKVNHLLKTRQEMTYLSENSQHILTRKENSDTYIQEKSRQNTAKVITELQTEREIDSALVEELILLIQSRPEEIDSFIVEHNIPLNIVKKLKQNLESSHTKKRTNKKAEGMNR